MHCPQCLEELKIAERQGIEIDYCPKCRGVWLDRGELDKIIERSVEAMAPKTRGSFPTGHEQHSYYPPHGKKKKKRRSFLDELFDFD